MNVFTIDNELFIRLAIFFSVFAFMAAWEVVAPRRRLTSSRRIRWLNNIGISFINSVLLRLLFPMSAVGVALLSSEIGWGAFNYAAISSWWTGIIVVVILDLTIYIQHFLFHKVPFFWRLHRMHHTDLDIDVTTGARFHPVEIIFSMGVKAAMVIILGAPAWSVLAFEVLLNATSMFNHSNIFMNKQSDRVLRLFIVTPDMHRVHHSVTTKETDSNFGFNLPWWDHLFGTYCDQPASGHDRMTIGLANYRERKWLTIPWMLVVPFSARYR